MSKPLKSWLRLFATIATMLWAAQAARAGDDSAWDGDSRAAARLIAGQAQAESSPQVLRAGVEIKLAKGWKTYWRYPGDSGVPPRFDFSGSENVTDVSVLWPAPHRFTDDGGTSIGYKDNVIFPLRVVARDRNKPVMLRLRLDYAICEKLCVPAEARATLPLVRGPSSHDQPLAAAEARVPKAAPLAGGGPLSVVTTKRVTEGAKPLVFVDVIAPAGMDVELFAEGPTPDWTLPIPAPAQGAPAGHRHFGFELDGLAPGVDPKGRFALTFTAVAGPHAIEVTTHLD